MLFKLCYKRRILWRDIGTYVVGLVAVEEEEQRTVLDGEKVDDSPRALGSSRVGFQQTRASGETHEKDRFALFFEVIRLAWQTLRGVPFRVHWNTGDTAFAQAVLDAARAGAQQAGLILDTEFSESVDVYVYGQLTDYQFARDAMGPLWAGGHADPEAGVIVVSLPPGENQALEI